MIFMGLNLKKYFNEESDDVNRSQQREEYYNGNGDAAIEAANKSGNKMILLEPRAFSEASQIVDHLKNKNSIVVNLKRVTADNAKRIIDFLSGSVYSLNGKIQQIGVGIYICVPNNVSVQNEISDEPDPKKGGKGKANNNNNDLDW